MKHEKTDKKPTFTEQIEVAGNELVERVKALLAEGNVRQLRIKAADGDTFVETPLTVGVLAGGAVALAAPWLAILAVVAALVTKVQIEVVREMPDAEATPTPEAEAGARPGKSRKKAA